jgi:hypothetical protein
MSGFFRIIDGSFLNTRERVWIHYFRTALHGLLTAIAMAATNTVRLVSFLTDDGTIPSIEKGCCSRESPFHN